MIKITKYATIIIQYRNREHDFIINVSELKEKTLDSILIES